MAVTDPPSRCNTCQHGVRDLPPRQPAAGLLDHAVELARAGGPDAVVLRDVQRAAGVSNSAAYRHYADRQAPADRGPDLRDDTAG